MSKIVFDQIEEGLREALDKVGWRDIETAPWDGSDILVSVTHNTSEQDWETIQWVDWRVAGNEWPVYWGRIDIPFQPTHWMHLPPPPFHTQSSKEQKDKRK